MPWYAVEEQLPRVGQKQIVYNNAPNKTAAAQDSPGGVVLGGPYLTEALAQKAFPQGSAGSVKPPAGEPPPTQNDQSINPLSGLAAIGDFFRRLTEEQTWERVGEVILGGILIYAGVRALTHGSTVVGSGARKAASSPVKKVAKTAVSVAAPEARLATRVAAKKVAPKTTARVAQHRATVKKYGAKTPYTPPKPRPATKRVSHVYYHSSKGTKVRKP